MQLRIGSRVALVVVVLSAGALAAGCSSSDSGTGSGAGGSTTGGQGGASGGTAGATATGGAGGTAGAAGSTSGGSGGVAGAAGGTGTGGAAPMCTTSAECKDAEVSYPGSSDPATTTATDCVGGQCGLATSYAGSYKSPKPTRSCDEICAASTYDGQAMKCSASCTTVTVNGFGDQSLAFDPGDAGPPGSVAGLVRYQFSPLSGGYKFVEVGCAEVPKSKLIVGSNSYTYVTHRCCCVAP